MTIKLDNALQRFGADAVTEQNNLIEGIRNSNIPVKTQERLIQELAKAWNLSTEQAEAYTDFVQKRMNLEKALNSYFIRGAEILMNEKENTYNANSFLSYLITDHFYSFNEYLNR